MMTLAIAETVVVAINFVVIMGGGGDRAFQITHLRFGRTGTTLLRVMLTSEEVPGRPAIPLVYNNHHHILH